MRARVKEVRPANPEGQCDWQGTGTGYHEHPTTLVAVMCPECDLYVVRKICDICMSKKINPALASGLTYRCTYCKAPGNRADQVWKVIGKYEPHG